ncbi:MAG TPA: Gfo/Idh/MocA family oxidoreductase [Candidatus Saccharimonadales bacterium]|jgi:predicted dehydrogenase
MKQIGVGIIGTGGISDSAHAPAISAVDQASLVAVLSRDETKGQDFLSRHNAGDATVHTTLESFVADPKINMVIICSPDGLHAEQASTCLNNGKHVLVEKPMSLSAEDALKLVELAKEKQLTLATGFHLRSHNGFRALHERLIEQGEIGNIRHIRAVWAWLQNDDSNWRAKDDLTKWWSLSGVGSHCIDLTRWFADDVADWKSFKPVIANNLWGGPHDETAVIAGQTSKGPTVEVVSSVQFGPYNRLEIFGDKGIAICEDAMGRSGAGKITINDSELQFKTASPFIGQLEDFISCVGTTRKPRADGSVGLRSVKDLVLATT